MPADVVTRILTQLKDSAGRAGELWDRYRESYDAAFRQDSRLHVRFARALVGAGQPTRALDVVEDGLGIHNPDFELELRYLQALAASRRGDLERTDELLATLVDHPGLSPTLAVDVPSLAGKLWKIRAERSPARQERERLTFEAAQAYEKAWRHARALEKGKNEAFPGVNAATLYRVSGEVFAARSLELAAAVEGRVRGDLADPENAEDYWLHATLGEALLLLGSPGEAVEAYRRAVDCARGKAGDIRSMLANVELLATVLAVPEEILSLLAVGSVVAFAGHMLDVPGRQPPRFPPDEKLEDAVRQAIRTFLDEHTVIAGFSSVACGADLLFAEEMLERRGELHIVLPFKREDFFRTSVDFGLSERRTWRRRAERVLARATAVHRATEESFLDDTVLFRLGNEVTQGLAVIRAGELGVEPLALAVAEPGAELKLGGTASFLSGWEEKGRTARKIDLAAIRQRVPGPWQEAAEAPPVAPALSEAATPQTPSAGHPRVVRAMLFSDLKNFSKLAEHQLPAFFVKFLGQVHDILQAIPDEGQPTFKNTWGDGLFMVFERVRDAADFALRLLERMAATDWQGLGLSGDLEIRIGLHAGPVFPSRDPLLDQENVFGSHVNRAARIEPVTQAGCAYVSEPFAALLALEPDSGITCEYVGVVDLPKDAGKLPLYRLKRRRGEPGMA